VETAKRKEKKRKEKKRKEKKRKEKKRKGKERKGKERKEKRKVLKIKMKVFWPVTLKIKAPRSAKTSIAIHQPTLRKNSHNLTLQQMAVRSPNIDLLEVNTLSGPTIMHHIPSGLGTLLHVVIMMGFLQRLVTMLHADIHFP
jgi:hypothetical protein